MDSITYKIVMALFIASIFIMLAHLLRCRNVYDKILAANFFGTITTCLLVFMGYLFDDLFTIDIAMIYALINFITTIAFMKYFKYKSFKN